MKSNSNTSKLKKRPLCSGSQGKPKRTESRSIFFNRPPPQSHTVDTLYQFGTITCTVYLFRVFTKFGRCDTFEMGTIHSRASLVEYQYSLQILALVFYSLTSFFSELSFYLDKLEVHITHGNHSQTNQSKRFVID